MTSPAQALGQTEPVRRAVAYVRESTEEQGEGYSPDAQRQAIARFAAENQLDLVDEYVDFHSGWRGAEKRPGFQRLMADAADGRFEVVLVYHTSRFARNQLEARRYKTMLRDRLGIAVVSVTQPLGEIRQTRTASCPSPSTRSSTSTTRSPSVSGRALDCVRRRARAIWSEAFPGDIGATRPPARSSSTPTAHRSYSPCLNATPRATSQTAAWQHG
jgi:Resolvase, N terminal domain